MSPASTTPQQRGRNNRRKGAAWERHVATWFRDWLGWHGAARRLENTTDDIGDFHGLPDWLVVDAKSGAFTSAMLEQLDVEQRNAGAQVAALFCKRRNHALPAHGFVVMRPDSFAYLLREANAEMKALEACEDELRALREERDR